MRTASFALTLLAVTVLASGSGSAVAGKFEPLTLTYDVERSPAWNFSKVLEQTAWQCALEASSGYSTGQIRKRMGVYEPPEKEADVLRECVIYANQQGEQAITRFMESRPTPVMIEMSKDVYSKWKTYMNTLSVFDPKDLHAEAQFRAARDALSTEEKFSK